MTRVGALVKSGEFYGPGMGLTRLWGIVTEDGKGYRSNQVRVRWFAGPRYGQRWAYITDLTFVTLPGDAKEPRT